MKKYKNVFEGSRCKFLHETAKTLSKTRHPLTLAFGCALRPVVSGYGRFRGVLGVPLRAGAEPCGVRRYKPQLIFEQANLTTPERHQHRAGGSALLYSSGLVSRRPVKGVILGGSGPVRNKKVVVAPPLGYAEPKKARLG